MDSVKIKGAFVPDITPAEISIQLNRLRATGFADFMAKECARHTQPALTAPLVYAIASRETNCINRLGDVQDGLAHGVGIMQIDVQHPLAKQMRDSGEWQSNPRVLIVVGIQMLDDNLAEVATAIRKHNLPITLTMLGQQKIAASGYNCGIGRAIEGYNSTGDSDTFTTGKNYGIDVIWRMQAFQAAIAAGATNASQTGQVSKSN